MPRGPYVIDSRIRRPTRYDWSRQKLLVKERAGIHGWRIVYFCQIDAYTVLNVWREGSYWRYVSIATRTKWLLAKGEAPTMHEAKLRAESSLGEEQPQTEVWKDGPHDRTDDTRLPF